MRATVILPCAGSGQRLGLAQPKELLPIGPARVLIDATLELLAPALARGDIGLVVVTRPDKLDTLRHVARQVPRTPLAGVFQAPDARPGLYAAVRSALPWCATVSVVLLPDEIVGTHAACPDPIGLLLDGLDRQPVGFLAARVSDARRLAADGALALDTDGHVTGYADKAGPLPETFNAVWTGFGFRRDAAPALLEVLDGAEATGPLSSAQLQRAQLAGAFTVPVASIRDLGTWSRYRDHWTQLRLAPVEPARDAPEGDDGEQPQH